MAKKWEMEKDKGVGRRLGIIWPCQTACPMIPDSPALRLHAFFTEVKEWGNEEQRDKYESLSESAWRMENSVNLNRDTQQHVGGRYLEGRETGRHRIDKDYTRGR